MTFYFKKLVELACPIFSIAHLQLQQFMFINFGIILFIEHFRQLFNCFSDKNNWLYGNCSEIKQSKKD